MQWNHHRRSPLRIRFSPYVLRTLLKVGARQLEDRQRALFDALSLSTPDPGTVGALVISINAAQKQFGQIEASFRNGFLGLLSDEQKSKLGFIQSVEAALRAAGALHQLGL